MTEWSSPLKIRPARVDDAKEIARIYNQGVQDRAQPLKMPRDAGRALFVAGGAAGKFPVLVAEVSTR